MEVITDKRIFNDPSADLSQPDGLGDIWNAVGMVGAAGVQLLPSLLGGGGSSGGGPARGLAAIQAAVQQAINSLQTLLQQAQSGNAASVLGEAQRITAALSNPQYVYQAQRGEDAAVLSRGKQQAAQIVAQIQALAGNTTASGSATPVAGVVTAADKPAVSAPLPNGSAINATTILIIGGLAALFLLKS